MRQPRKLKKAIKNAVIIYDVNAKPSSLSFEEVVEAFKIHGWLLYDSSKGICPIVNKVGLRVKILNRKKNNNLLP